MSCNQNIILKAVLECGDADLSILDDVGYDLGEIVEDLIVEGIKPTLNAIMGEVFFKAVDEMAERIEDEIIETREWQEDIREDQASELKEYAAKLDALQRLNAGRDIGWYCNCLDTRIYFNQNEGLYREYLADAISDIEGKTGFSF